MYMNAMLRRYYELLQARVAGEVDDVAIVRFEQLLPFPFDHAAKVAETYPNADFVWAQEEPKNMGGAFYLPLHFKRILLTI